MNYGFRGDAILLENSDRSPWVHSAAAPIERLPAQLLSDMLDPEGVVDRVIGHVAAEDAEDLLRDRGGHVPQGLLGLGRAVGCEQDVGASDQGMAGRGWL